MAGVGIDIRLHANMDQIGRRMTAMGNRYKTELVAVNRKAANLVRTEFQRRAVKESGRFSAMGKVGASSRNGFVKLKGSRDTGDYIGVAEFGGTIPRFQGKSKRQSFTHVKPSKKDGYFLTPALEHERDPIVSVYQVGINQLAAKYF